MNSIKIVDSTLRHQAASGELSLTFKEKLELVRELGRLGVGVIETAPVAEGRSDALLVKTLAMNAGDSILSCAVGTAEGSARRAWEALSEAAKPRLHVILPVSPVKMEYDCGMKPDAMLKAISELVRECAALCPDVEFSADDATRAEGSFLASAVSAAIEAGAGTVTLCDTAGVLMPSEYGEFIGSVRAACPGLESVTLGVQCSSAMKMGTASVFAAIAAGASQVKLTVDGRGLPSVQSFAEVLRSRGDSLGISCGLDMTGLRRAMSRLTWMDGEKSPEAPPPDAPKGTQPLLGRDSTITDVSRALAALGYNLSPDDEAKVFEGVGRIAARKETVGPAELDAIVASVAMQVPATYKVVSYVINSGNIIDSTANILLEKNGERLRGIAAGDGPVDAAFQAIERIAGRHYELDDFQISAVTEGRGAMGSALVKLRSGSGLYSGRGVSTDIVGAALRAYIDALNKITYEEENNSLS